MFSEATCRLTFHCTLKEAVFQFLYLHYEIHKICEDLDGFFAQVNVNVMALVVNLLNSS